MIEVHIISKQVTENFIINQKNVSDYYSNACGSSFSFSIILFVLFIGLNIFFWFTIFFHLQILLHFMTFLTSIMEKSTNINYTFYIFYRKSKSLRDARPAFYFFQEFPITFISVEIHLTLILWSILK